MLARSSCFAFPSFLLIVHQKAARTNLVHQRAAEYEGTLNSRQTMHVIPTGLAADEAWVSIPTLVSSSTLRLLACSFQMTSPGTPKTITRLLCPGILYISTRSPSIHL